MIKAAPFSFVMVCVVAIAACLGAFRWLYTDKLKEANTRSEQWKSDVEYWKDLANRKPAPPDCPSAPSGSIPPPSGPIRKSKKGTSAHTPPSPSPTPSESPQTTINVPNGIGISGGNVENPTVNNFGPPPVRLTLTQVRDVIPPAASGQSEYKYEKELTVSVSGSYSPVSVGVLCDKPLKAINGSVNAGGSFGNIYMGMDAGRPNLGLVYWEGVAATPSRPVMIRVWADEPFSVKEVGPVKIKGIND
jgi:hypothetical protein